MGEAPTADWMRELTRRGMDVVRAELLATSPDVDVAAVVAALDRGCDPDLAWRIWNTEPSAEPPPPLAAAPVKKRRRGKTKPPPPS